jgi:4-hydroxyacetophenone monooxygenase
MTTNELVSRMTHRAAKSVVSEEELRRHAVTVAARQLLLVAVHVTGDVGLLDRFEHRLPAVADPIERAFRGDDPANDPPELREELLDLLCSVLTSDDQPPYLYPDDPALFERLATVAIGTAVDPAQMAPTMEQGGFAPDWDGSVPVESPEGFSLAIIGAGMVGIDAAVKAAARGIPFTVYEKAAGIGGIWWSQTYPGVAVDTPALYYQLSYEINANWSKLYPLGEEYRLYLNHIVEKYEVASRIQCNASVTKIQWLEDEQLWELTVVDTTSGSTRTERHNAVLTGTGQFAAPKYPDVPGRESFRGEQVHSFEWRDVPAEGARVAVVGVGASGAQVISELGQVAGQMTIFQRQPHWVSPNWLPNDGVVQDGELWLRVNLPYYLHWTRFVVSYYANVMQYHFVCIDPEWVAAHPDDLSISEINHQYKEFCREYLNDTFGEGSELAQKLTPDFPAFAKRTIHEPTSFGPGSYYWVYCQPHVELVTDPIVEVVPEGIRTADGSVYEADVLIWATGMNTEFLATLEVVGRDGVRLRDVWGAYDARTYLGGTVPGFPNLFINDGPNSGIGAGGAGHNFPTELIDHYAFECLRLMFERGASAIEVTQEAHDRHNARIDEAMEKLIWVHYKDAHTYFRNDAGRVVFQNPFPARETWELCRTPDESAFVFADGRPPK